MIDFATDFINSSVENFPKTLTRYFSIGIQYPIKWNNARMANTPTGTMTVAFGRLISWRRSGRCWQYSCWFIYFLHYNIASALKIAAIIDAIALKIHECVKWCGKTIGTLWNRFRKLNIFPISNHMMWCGLTSCGSLLQRISIVFN